MFAWRRTAVRRRVVVNLRSGNALVGVLFARRGRLLVLKQATLHAVHAAPAPIDGDAVVEIGQIDFVQVLPVHDGDS